MNKLLFRTVRTDRLREIALAIADGNRDELTMRVPAEPERDADLVIMSAAEELDALRAELAAAKVLLQRSRDWISGERVDYNDELLDAINVFIAGSKTW